MSSDSDSDDSNDARLREAAVSFEDINKANEKKKTSDSTLAAAADQNHHFTLDVTPEFQSFVAKKLTKILDDSIELIYNNVDDTDKNKKKKKKLKFQLTNDIKYVELRDKEVVVVSSSTVETHNEKQREKRKKHLIESDDEDEEKQFKEMCKEAAISSDVIFNTSCINEHKKTFFVNK